MRAYALAAAALAVLVGPALAVIPPAAVTVRASSGQSYEGNILGAGEVHSFLLEDFYPMTFSISLKAGKGSTLLPDISLYDPSAVDITASLAAFRKDGAKSVAVKNAPAFGSSGRHTLQVKGKSGSTGSYLLKVTAKAVKSFKGTGLVPSPATTSFDVFAPTESLVTLKVVKGAGSVLVAEFVSVGGPSCTSTSLVPSLKVGQASFVSPLSGDYTVEIGGDGGTGGTFNWSAKVKTVKPSKKPVRVNGGAPFLALPGPSGGILTANAGQTVQGYAADALGVFWREVRTTGGGPNGNKNSIQGATLKGGNLPSLANNFATDAAPDPQSFGLGPTHAAVVAEGSLFGVPRAGGGEDELTAAPGTVNRVLADRDFAFTQRADGIRRYALDGSGSADVYTDAEYTYFDMALGAIGLVFAGEDTSGDLVIAMVDRDGGGFQVLATISPNPGFFALAARGTDAFFAVDDGDGGASLFRASACDPGNAVPLCPDFTSPVRAMAADDQNAYALEDDGTDGVRLRQIPRGGGESFVLFRGNMGALTLADDNLAAAGGYAIVQAAEGGKDVFYRVKRR